MQETVYAFRVEKYLKGSYGPWLKVRQMGGPLPWNLGGGAEGVGFNFEENPFPTIGNRYILFLMDPKIELPYFSKSEFVSEERGNPSVIYHFTDEMRLTDQLYGKILLKNRATEALEEKWSFGIGPEILGKTESEAVKLLSSLIADDAARLKKYDDFTEQKYGVRPDR